MCQYLTNPQTSFRKLISEIKFSTMGKWVVSLIRESGVMSQNSKKQETKSSIQKVMFAESRFKLITSLNMDRPRETHLLAERTAHRSSQHLTTPHQRGGPTPSNSPSKEPRSLRGPTYSKLWQSSCFLHSHIQTCTCIFSSGMYFQSALLCFCLLESIWTSRRLPPKSWGKFYLHYVWPPSPHPIYSPQDYNASANLIMFFCNFEASKSKI